MSAAGGEKRKPLAKWAFRGVCPSSFPLQGRRDGADGAAGRADGPGACGGREHARGMEGEVRE